MNLLITLRIYVHFYLYNKFFIIIIVCNFHRENLKEKKKDAKDQRAFYKCFKDWLTVKYRNNGLPNEEEWKSIEDEDIMSVHTKIEITIFIMLHIIIIIESPKDRDSRQYVLLPHTRSTTGSSPSKIKFVLLLYTYFLYYNRE